MSTALQSHPSEQLHVFCAPLVRLLVPESLSSDVPEILGFEAIAPVDAVPIVGRSDIEPIRWRPTDVLFLLCSFDLHQPCHTASSTLLQ